MTLKRLIYLNYNRITKKKKKKKKKKRQTLLFMASTITIGKNPSLNVLLNAFNKLVR